LCRAAPSLLDFRDGLIGVRGVWNEASIGKIHMQVKLLKHSLAD
jgi:hypothetical protein